jgi:hypothetical protein
VRREKDLRTYGNILRSRTPCDWKLWLASKTKPRVSENSYKHEESNAAIIYEGLGKLFYDIKGESVVIANWLHENRRPGETLCSPFDIAVHVRLGDFISGRANDDSHNVRQEIEWYQSALDMAKTLIATSHGRIRLFTDGDATEVAQDLKLTGHDIDTSKSALNAILNMARASVIVTSRSSFSMWGAYLGNSVAIWDRRFKLERSFPLRDGLDVKH